MGTIEDLEARYIINTYNRSPGETPCLVRGEGSYVWDESGKKYLDFLSGLAVNLLGHCHPDLVAAIGRQASRLIHTSNLYYTAPQAYLAQALVESIMPGGKVFFANSGAEANEAAIKLARKYKPERYKIIAADNSFHGRTMATLSATGQPKYREPFKPLFEGFDFAAFNDLDSVAALIDKKTAAVMVEPIQGEGGIHVAEQSFLKGLRELCNREGILLIFDEVQCGLGRTGKLWACEHWAVKPDLLTTAKGLGGGLPIGALVANQACGEILQPGDHASTFGGNPVTCSAALAVLNQVREEMFLEAVRERGLALEERLFKMAADYPELVKEARGMGLIRGLQLNKTEAKKIQGRCTEKGLLINAIGDDLIRFLPPLNIKAEELEEGLKIVEAVLKEIHAEEHL